MPPIPRPNLSIPAIPTLTFDDGFVVDLLDDTRHDYFHARWRSFGPPDYPPFCIYVAKPDTFMTWLDETEEDGHCACNAASITHLGL